MSVRVKICARKRIYAAMSVLVSVCTRLRRRAVGISHSEPRADGHAVFPQSGTHDRPFRIFEHAGLPPLSGQALRVVECNSLR